MNRAEMIANYRIFKGWRVVENVFRILSFWFRVFHEAILLHPDKVKDFVLCCVVLHNKLTVERGAGGRKRVLEDEVIPTDFVDGDPCNGHDRNPPSAKK